MKRGDARNNRVAFAAAIFSRFVEPDAYLKDHDELEHLDAKIECAWRLAGRMARADPLRPKPPRRPVVRKAMPASKPNPFGSK